MFGVSGGELLVVALAALLVLGPKKLPEAARTAGRFFGRLNSLLSEARATLKVDLNELSRPRPAPSSEAPPPPDPDRRA